MLAALAPDSLARLRFPLGDLTKPQVRELARRAGLAVAGKPDSQDLCFLAGTRRSASSRATATGRAAPGAIVDRDGTRLGEHGGIAARSPSGSAAGSARDRRQRAAAVRARTDRRSNTVTVGPRAPLLTRRCRVRDVTLHRDGDGRRRGRSAIAAHAAVPPGGASRPARMRIDGRADRAAPSAPLPASSPACMRAS